MSVDDQAADLVRDIRQKRAELATVQAEIDDLVLRLLRVYAGDRAPSSLTPARPTVQAIADLLNPAEARDSGLTRREIADALGVVDLDALSRLLSYLKKPPAGSATAQVSLDRNTGKWRRIDR